MKSQRIFRRGRISFGIIIFTILLFIPVFSNASHDPDLNDDGIVNTPDLDIIKASFAKSSGDSGFDPRADTNHDGVINVFDLFYVARNYGQLYPTDTTPPSINVTNPVDGSIVDTRRPDINISFSDTESGIDTNSFTAQINGVDSTGLFTVTETGATYQPAIDLPIGDNTITAGIKDNAGNENNTVSNFRIAILRAIPGAFPTSGPSPLTVTFTQSGEDPGGTIQVYRWDFQGDGSWDTYTQVARNYTYTYNQSVTYNAILQVTSSTGKTATAEVTITVENNPPVASADVIPSNGEVPLTVSMQGSGTDSDGSISII